MPTLEECRREVEALHEFFVEWYAASDDREAFGRLEAALAPDFQMITPTGERHDRSTVLEWIREARGRDSPGEFDIDIRGVELRARFDDHALVRYEEWQRRPDDRNGRITTALFRRAPDAPGGVVWVDVHETALEQGDGDR